MIVFDQRLDLAIDSGAVEAHHEELAHLPAVNVSIVDITAVGIYGQPVKIVPHWGKLAPDCHGFPDSIAGPPCLMTALVVDHQSRTHFLHEAIKLDQHG